MRFLIALVLLFSGAAQEILIAQNPSAPKTVTPSCTFSDGQQISVRYEPEVSKMAELPMGELWPPSSSPIYLFTPVELSLANSDIPPAAYSMYVIPGKQTWTLVINKGVSAGRPYDQQQDLLRAPLQIGHLSHAVPRVKVVFGHVAPKQCNMRIYYGKIGVWAEFKEK